MYPPHLLPFRTGHTGVGSIINCNNARVASELGLDMLMVVNGGLGDPFDQLALNFLMCHKYGVRVKGIVLNKVIKVPPPAPTVAVYPRDPLSAPTPALRPPFPYVLSPLATQLHACHVRCATLEASGPVLTLKA